MERIICSDSYFDRPSLTLLTSAIQSLISSPDLLQLSRDVDHCSKANGAQKVEKIKKSWTRKEKKGRSATVESCRSLL